MSQQVSSSDDTLVGITDRNLIVFLIFSGKVWRAKNRVDLRKTVFWFDRVDIQEPIHQWQSGQTLPCDDIRKVFMAEMSFNSAVHDDC